MDIVQRVEELIAQHAEVAMVATAHIHILPRLILLTEVTEVGVVVEADVVVQAVRNLDGLPQVLQ